MSFYPSQTQKVVEEYSINVRNLDRQTIIQKKRQQCLSNVATPTIYTFKDFTSSIAQFVELEFSDDMRFEMLKPALQFTSSDDFSHQANKLLIETPDLIQLLKQTVYDENQKLEYRADSLLLLAQMLESNYELCARLIQMGVLDLMIDLTKISFNHNNQQFLSHSLIGLANSISHDVKIRNIFIENQLDQLFLQILNKYDSTIIQHSIASIMDDWFRNKVQNINVELFLNILQKLLVSKKCSYQDELSWFIYSFTNHSLEQIKNIDLFIESLINIPNFVQFVRMKMLKIDQLGSVAIIRTLAKLYKSTINYQLISNHFYEDIRKLYSNVKQYEVNMFRMEVLRLIQAIYSNSNCLLLAEEFTATQHYYNVNIKCQDYCLIAIKMSNLEIFDQQQQQELAQKCINVLTSYLDDVSTLNSILTIMLKLILIDESFNLRFLETVPLIDKLVYHDNQGLKNLAENLLNRFHSYQ